MNTISDRGDSPVFFNENGSLCQKTEDLVWYRDESGAIVFKDQSQIKKTSQEQKPTKNQEEPKP